MTLNHLPENAECCKALPLKDILAFAELALQDTRPEADLFAALGATEAEMIDATSGKPSRANAAIRFCIDVGLLPPSPPAATKAETPPEPAAELVTLDTPTPAALPAESPGADVEVQITFGETYATGKTQPTWPEAVKMPWPEVRERLLKHVAGPKHGSCFIPTSLGLSDVRGKDGAMRQERRRSGSAVQSISACVFDLDDGGMSITAAEASLKARGLEAVIYTTHSHRSEKPRFRVVIPLEKPWIASAFENPTAARLTWRRGYFATAAELGFKIDESGADLNRLFYEGRHDEGAPFETRHVKGRPLNVDFTPVPTAEVKRFVQTQADLRGDPDILDLAMKALPNDGAFEDRKAYVEVARACFGAYEDNARGFEAFSEWAARWAKRDAHHDETTWDSFTDSRLGALYIYRLAIKHSGGKFTHAMASADPAYVTQAAEWAERSSTAPEVFLNVIEDDAPSRDTVAKAGARPKSFSEFTAEYTPLNYVVQPLFMTAYLYTLTGKTGAGKTAFLSALALAVATGRKDILGLEVEKGRVLYCTFENPEDFRMKLMIAAHAYGADASALDRRLYVLDAKKPPEAILADVQRLSECGVGPFLLVIVDTLMAAFTGDDVNSPTQGLQFIRRWRPFGLLPGKPAVVIAAHPTKNAGEDNLVPLGAGSVVNEVDGNMTLWGTGCPTRDEPGGCRLGWFGKIRGENFQPIEFQLALETCPAVCDKDGRLIQAPVLRPSTEAAVEAREASDAGLDRRILITLRDNPEASLRRRSAALSVTKAKLEWRLKALERDKLIRKRGKLYVLTRDGSQSLKPVNGQDVFLNGENPDVFH